MNDQKHTKLFCSFPLNTVDDLMRDFDIHIICHLGMQRSHTSSRTIIMYNQIMCPKDSFMGFHKFCYLFIHIFWNCLTEQWLQRIFCDPYSCPHNNKRHADSYNPINIPARKLKYQQWDNRRRCCDHIAHRIRCRCKHHIWMNPRSKLLIEHPKPKLNPDGQQ